MKGSCGGSANGETVPAVGDPDLVLTDLAGPSASPRNPSPASLVTDSEQQSRCLCGKKAAPDICLAVGSRVCSQIWLESPGGRGGQLAGCVTSNLIMGQMG